MPMYHVEFLAVCMGNNLPPIYRFQTLIGQLSVLKESRAVKFLNEFTRRYTAGDQAWIVGGGLAFYTDSEIHTDVSPDSFVFFDKMMPLFTEKFDFLMKSWDELVSIVKERCNGEMRKKLMCVRKELVKDCHETDDYGGVQASVREIERLKNMTFKNALINNTNFGFLRSTLAEYIEDRIFERAIKRDLKEGETLDDYFNTVFSNLGYEKVVFRADVLNPAAFLSDERRYACGEEVFYRIFPAPKDHHPE